MTKQEILIDECKTAFLKRLNEDYNITISKKDIVVSSEIHTGCLKLRHNDIWNVFTKVKY